MEIVTMIIKYTFVVGLGIELLLILRALVNLAREKARLVQAPAAAAEE